VGGAGGAHGVLGLLRASALRQDQGEGGEGTYAAF
jgi:hypothetical protein